MAVEMKNESNGGIDLYALPEGCIAIALSLTSPRDACRLSLVASTFRSAALCDEVWERFFPADYRDVLCRSAEGIELLRSAISMKQLYLHLCDKPVLIDGGSKSFSLEKSSGKKCYMLAARDLTIVWSDTPRYWKWIPLPESRFSVVAELLDVCWLEIRGKIRTSMLSPETNYAAYLVFTSKSRIYGFEYQPAEAEVGISGQEGKKQAVHLDPDGAQRPRHQIMPRWRRGLFGHHLAGRMIYQETLHADQDVQNPRQRGDGWMEVELGEIFIKEGQDVDLEMSLMEVKGGNWKSGLIVEGIEIRPKEGK
ncbi:putative F-box protein PP2-B12 [Coffea arabica]|uniref:F-box protein PP2-B12 n=1 Tax=Coffea arabica TaxID=13443 RepID=A0ABM4VRH3_COFAR